MTENRLKDRVRRVVLAVAGLIAVAAALKVLDRDEEYGVVKDLSPLALAIPAAFLAVSFQERAAFLQALRHLWSSMIAVKNELFSYTTQENPGEDAYRKAFNQLSQVIDEVRGVYRNVGESDQSLGLFPYQPLHDMRKTLRNLGPGPNDEQARDEALQEFEQAWQSLRAAFLPELSPADPPRPITTHRSRDPRR